MEKCDYFQTTRMFASWIFPIVVLLPYTLQADHSYESSEIVSKSRQRFPKVRTDTNNHLHSSEHKYHKHPAKDVDYSSEEASEECQCTCDNCTVKSCCDKDLCNECILQQSSVMLIPYNYPYVMSPYNMAAGSVGPVTVQNVTTTVAPTTIITQRLSSLMDTPVEAKDNTAFYRPEETVAPILHNRRQDPMTEQEIIRNYILGKLHEENQHASIKQINAETVRDLQKTPSRRVDKSIFKARRATAEGDQNAGNPYEDVERLLQYVKSVRKEKLRPEMKDI